MSRDRRQAKLSFQPSVTKRPVIDTGRTDQHRPLRFRFDRVDVSGPWCLSHVVPDDHRELLRKLREFETMTTSEAFHSRPSQPGKDYPEFSGLCPEAIERLKTINADDEDGISRLRLTGTKRLYGFRHGSEFSIVWWDPEHQICPSELGHT